jgi:hypothetical protein
MEMVPIFRRVDPDAEEQELTQEDQFNTDEVTLAETLVRESLQNSNDARVNGGSPTVRVCFGVTQPTADTAEFWRPLLQQLDPHLKSAQVVVGSIDYGMPRILTIEDFGTTGLTGSYEKKDDSNFQDFWRRVGRSHKGGDKVGSWGLGKIVFPASSRIRTFFGLTVRYDDKNLTPLLMGQSVLRHHVLEGVEYAPIGLFAVENSSKFRIPVIDPAVVERFRKAAGLKRTTEPGLSIAIPFLHDDIKTEDLIPHVVQNYFFPIITGRLEVEIAGEKITAATFDSLAAKHGGKPLAGGHLVAFIRDINTATDATLDFQLPEGWSVQNLADQIGTERLKALREAYVAGKLIHVRAPVMLNPRQGDSQLGSFDLFLKLALEGVQAQPLFIRDSITIPNEAQFFPSRQTFAALVANDSRVSRFLRDAENPAHTRWNGNARRLNDNWKSAGSRLSQIRNSLRALHDLLAQAIERVEQDALINILSIPASGTDKKAKKPPVVKPPPVPPIPSKPKVFTIEKLKNGFTVRAGKGLSPEQLPLSVKVKMGYDVMRGDPIKRHSPFDFDLTNGKDVAVTPKDATWSAEAPNEMRIEALSPDFEVKVLGFDINRDLKVKATR